MMNNRLRYKVPYILLFVVSLGVFILPLGINGDEIWNYSFAKNICDGLVPYRDFSIVQTPLSSYIAALFLKITGNELFSFRILSALLSFATFTVFYRLTFKIINERSVAIATALIVFAVNFITWIYNYNNLILLIILSEMLLELSLGGDKRKNTVLTVVLSLVIGLAPMIKQTTGPVLVSAHALIAFIDVHRGKTGKRTALLRIVLSVLPGILFVLLLIIGGIWNDFLDYALFGTGGFVRSSTLWTFAFENPIFFAMAVLFVAAIIIPIIRLFRKKEGRLELALLLLCASAGLIVAYPICDYTHIAVAFTPFVPCVLYGVRINTLKLYEKLICIFTGFFVAVCSVVAFSPLCFDAEDYSLCELKHFRFIPCNTSVEKSIVQMDDYIIEQKRKGKRVIVSDIAAPLYMIPLDIYNKNLDMPLYGNVGTNSVEEILENNGDTVYLVVKDQPFSNKQIHKGLIEYIIENYNPMGDFLIYDVYESGE